MIEVLQAQSPEALYLVTELGIWYIGWIAWGGLRSLVLISYSDFFPIAINCYILGKFHFIPTYSKGMTRRRNRAIGILYCPRSSAKRKKDDLLVGYCID